MSAAPGVDSRTFRQVFDRHPSGVVVMAAAPGHGPARLTLTSLPAVAVDPPLRSFGTSRGGITCYLLWKSLRHSVVLLMGLGTAATGCTAAGGGPRRPGRPSR